ncbi:DUF4037 domain-containing protein [Bifidobacterium scaligerum]|uniref:DUF4037 domain-containing protein n=1 Tax=Bifidobacterium scaligerum TaxID=2052656 RepID=A0A2M9HRL7_9BIFI|nr:DUF4037 domain-containing protein [Bifidobacterium scaligerum]PJM79409.1 hypothetical protein CUU80_05170 [Bifidobacterium scaligerum]
MVDEDALLQQFAAQFEHGAADVDDTDEDQDTPADFDVNDFLQGLDDIFNRHAAAHEAGPYLEQAAVDAENAGDEAGLLTVLNETMGFYRSQGRHQENQWIVQRALELAARMGLTTGTSEAWATTLINCATAMRAAKQYDQAEDLYHQAQDVCSRAFSPTDRRLAALHNNLSMLYSETGRADQAEAELREALRIVEESSVNPEADIDVASSHTNLALALLSSAGDDPVKLKDAHQHAAKALDIYKTGHLEHSAHYASALAGFAQVCFAEKRYADAVDGYRRALAVIEECYGRDTDYWRITEENLREAERQAEQHVSDLPVPPAQQPSADSATAPCDHENATSDPSGNAHKTAAGATPHIICPISGLKLARAFWKQVGKPMIETKYPQYASRIAAGLVGHGSECYGFDDAYSQDHDFGPRFCLWLSDEDYAVIGAQLQADYESLPRNFVVDEQGQITFVSADETDSNADTHAGGMPSPTTPRAQGARRRDGVFRIGDFFTAITGYAEAPAAEATHEWLMLDEATLATATNGEVFADPVGLLSKTRQGFKNMPEDVRLALISKRLGMIAQAGQYNLPRSLQRTDGAAAWLSINEFVEATASLVFLINTPMVAGYMPYYKWRFAALRKLSGSIFAKLPDICSKLEDVMRLASAACYGGAGFGEGGKGSAPAAARIESIVEQIAEDIVKELLREHLTTSGETFLEWQRPYVEEHIQTSNPILHSL